MLNLFDQFITNEEYERAKQNGISKRVLDKRVRYYFWDKERAITTLVRKKVRKLDKKWIKIALNNGISYEVLRGRIYGLGWSIEKSATEPLADMKNVWQNIGKNNKKYPSWIYEKLKENNIPLGVFYKRINKSKWKLEDAISVPVMNKRPPNY